MDAGLAVQRERPHLELREPAARQVVRGERFLICNYYNFFLYFKLKQTILTLLDIRQVQTNKKHLFTM